MDGERRKRKIEQNEQEEDDEEGKMAKFFSLIRSTKEVRERIMGGAAAVGKSREEQKLGNEEKPASTWHPKFRLEDFMEDGQGQPSRVVHASRSKGEKGGKHDEKEKEGDGLDLKLSL
ncbi:hypothetical protein RJ639_025444 [Escallonia herrerae]|uniref:Uncharacterized protein n=1 Tax=Escallonia herrerae TaxID=1293975 RepID=A0AA88RVS1_9ASTE|nr:hypothetical protein RJ639_025444 [Escallonia herrerae]